MNVRKTDGRSGRFLFGTATNRTAARNDVRVSAKILLKSLLRIVRSEPDRLLRQCNTSDNSSLSELNAPQFRLFFPSESSRPLRIYRVEPSTNFLDGGVSGVSEQCNYVLGADDDNWMAVSNNLLVCLRVQI